MSEQPKEAPPDVKVTVEGTEEKGEEEKVSDGRQLALADLFESDETNPLKRGMGDHKPKSLILFFLKSITSLKKGQDLSRFLIPCFFLETQSLLEKYSDLHSHNQLVLNIADEKDPVRRMLMVLRWYLSSWHIQPKHCRKPYNPLLGETFFCMWDHGESQTYSFAEQVSHHPPISALYLENRKRNITITGQIYTKGKFLGNSAASIPVGGAHLHVCNLGEEYVLNYPTMYARGLVIGRMRVEIAGKTEIRCAKTGLVTQVEFRPKPMFGGEYHRVRGKVRRIGAPANQFIFSFEGKWNGPITISTPSGRTQHFLEPPRLAYAHKLVKKIKYQVQTVCSGVWVHEEQGPWESRRLWKGLTEALLQEKPDYEAGTVFKNRLEVLQRKRRKDRHQKQLPYHNKMFKKVEDRWVFRNEHFMPYEEGEEKRPDFEPNDWTAFHTVDQFMPYSETVSTPVQTKDCEGVPEPVSTSVSPPPESVAADLASLKMAMRLANKEKKEEEEPKEEEKTTEEKPKEEKPKEEEQKPKEEEQKPNEEEEKPKEK